MNNFNCAVPQHFGMTSFLLTIHGQSFPQEGKPERCLHVLARHRNQNPKHRRAWLPVDPCQGLAEPLTTHRVEESLPEHLCTPGPTALGTGYAVRSPRLMLTSSRGAHLLHLYSSLFKGTVGTRKVFVSFCLLENNILSTSTHTRGPPISFTHIYTSSRLSPLPSMCHR